MDYDGPIEANKSDDSDKPDGVNEGGQQPRTPTTAKAATATVIG